MLERILKNLVSNHVEYAKSLINKKCAKAKRTIYKLKCRLSRYENYPLDNEREREERDRILKRIEECEKRLENMILLRISLETVDCTKF